MTDAPEAVTPPVDVAAQHARYDRHADDRVRLFEAVAAVLPRGATVLYPGSFIDIGPSVWFDRVTYVDTDRWLPAAPAAPGSPGSPGSARSASAASAPVHLHSTRARSMLA